MVCARGALQGAVPCGWGLFVADRDLCLIIDDIGYVSQSKDEMEVLFTLLAERYERRSVVIISNLVFSQWDLQSVPG